MDIANRFNLPVLTFIDTAGAYPGIGAEERGQAEAIARTIETSLSISVPSIAVILGEGGSGGAVALATANQVLMLNMLFIRLFHLRVVLQYFGEAATML